MDIRIETNAADVSRTLRAFFADQAAFATSVGINDTAKDVQAAQRAQAHEAFTIRRKPFVERAFKIKPFATKASLEATILIDPPGGQARADIITRHEERGQRTPHAGRSLVVPVKARPSPTSLVPKRLRPGQLGLQVMSRRGGVEIAVGKRGERLIRFSDGSGVILDRRGEVLHALRPETPIPGDLEFYATAERVARARMAENMRAAWMRAIHSAR